MNSLLDLQKLTDRFCGFVGLPLIDVSHFFSSGNVHEANELKIKETLFYSLNKICTEFCFNQQKFKINYDFSSKEFYSDFYKGYDLLRIIKKYFENNNYSLQCNVVGFGDYLFSKKSKEIIGLMTENDLSKTETDYFPDGKTKCLINNNHIVFNKDVSGLGELEFWIETDLVCENSSVSVDKKIIKVLKNKITAIDDKIILDETLIFLCWIFIFKFELGLNFEQYQNDFGSYLKKCMDKDQLFGRINYFR